MKKAVVILGAGPAGLTVGYELLKRAQTEYDVIILEREDRVGGISGTVSAGPFSLDLGGHRYYSKNDHIVDWWKSVLAKDDLLQIRRSSKILYRGQLIEYPLNLNFETMKTVGAFRGLKIILSYLHAKVFQSEEDNLEGFFRNRFGNELYQLFFREYTEKVWGREPSEISSEWGYQRVRSVSIGSLIKNAVEGRKNREKEPGLTNDFYYPRYGSGYLWESVAHAFCRQGGKLLRGNQVTKLCVQEGKVTELHSSDGLIFHPDYVISSVPLVELADKMEGIAPDIAQTAKSLEYRSLVVVGLLFSKDCMSNTFLLDTSGNLIKDQWIYLQEPNVKAGRMQLLNNWSTDLQKSADNHSVCLALEYFCCEKDELWMEPDDFWIDTALKDVTTILHRKKPLPMLSEKVARVSKAYPCYWGAYHCMSQLKHYFCHIKNLVCVGRNGQHQYYNIDDAMETSMRAVDYILGQSSLESVWDENHEKKIQEE